MGLSEIDGGNKVTSNIATVVTARKHEQTIKTFRFCSSSSARPAILAEKVKRAHSQVVHAKEILFFLFFLEQAATLKANRPGHNYF